LRKSYFLFISAVVTNNLSAVIASQGTFSACYNIYSPMLVHFVHAGTQNVQQILETIIQGAVAFPDPSVNY
jgi:hypothetical protein